MITKEPRIDYKDVFAALFVGLGFILLLVILHILSIRSSGNVSDVMNTTFIIFLNIFIGLGIFAISFVIIHLLKWLVWSATTPIWLKKKVRENNKKR